MNRFDELVKKHYDATPAEDRPFGFFDKCLTNAIADLGEEMSQQDAHRLIYRSESWWALSITTAAGIQRTVILQLMDRAGL